MNINDIANIAGVSKAAVSRYFNGGYLSGEKKSAIEKAVADTGYIPNAQAQTLRTLKTRQIGIVLPKISSESISRVVDGISSVLFEQNYLILLADTANSPEKELEYLELFRHHRVEGVIFIATVFTPDHRLLLENMHIPVVIVGQRYEGFDCVYHDDRGAAQALTSLMLDKGRRHIGMLGVTNRDLAAGAGRQAGYVDALRAHGIVPDIASDVCIADFNMESGYEKAAQLLAGDKKYDALLCATDNIAAGAMQYCRENGISIPGDMMLAGFGDSRICRVMPAPLTSAHLYYKTSGEEAARIMLGLLRSRPSGRELRLGYEIMERASTGNE